jgi:ubiquinone biosynthesis protein
MLRTVSRIRNLPREREIAEVFARHGFGFVLRKYALGRFVLRFRGVAREDRLPAHWGDELRAILEELGPTYIKMGQVLSIRPDIFPPEVLFALRGLRDQVTPVPFEEIRPVIESELGAPLDELFEEFDTTPIGSASIGQVYVARHNGQKVAVKVQRPRAAATVEADLAVIADIAGVVKRRSKDLFFDPLKLVDEVKQFLLSELDYTEEARNTSRVRDNFAGDERVRIPEVHWDRSTSRVITTEFIEGTPLSHLDPGAFTPEDRERLATLGAELSMTQVFEHGVFHGDAHPSNILVVSPDQYGLIDFGLVGHISEREMRIITDYVIHLVRQQPERLVRDMRNLGVVIPRGFEDDVASAIGGLLRRYYGVSLRQIDTNRMVTELLDIFYRYKIQLPTKYFLILRGLTTVEGTGRELYPDFNVFDVAEPYVRRMALRRFSPRSMAGENVDRISDLMDTLSRYPGQLSDVLEEVQETLRETRRLEELMDSGAKHAHRLMNRLALAVFVAALIIGAPQVKIGPRVLGVPLFDGLMLWMAFILSLWLVIGFLRSGGL